MTSKERVYKAIRHEEPDRIPLYVWYHPTVADILAEKEGCSGWDLEIKLGNDILQTWVSINRSQVKVEKDGVVFTDEFGIKWRHEGQYNMIIYSPLADVSPENYGDYIFPDPDDPERYEIFKSLINDYGDEYFIGSDVSGSIFEPLAHICGMENILTNMIIFPDETKLLLDRVTEFTLKICRNSLELGADMIWFGDDVGTQKDMIMSPEMWRREFKPRMKYMIDILRKQQSDVIIAYHSCGTIRQIIPDLIEIGVNVLNPVQAKCANMNQVEISGEFGDKLTFHCGIDTQFTLPFASDEEFEDEMKTIISEIAPGGGLIFTGSHTIQDDTSINRIYRMLEILKEKGDYPINY